MLARLVRWSLDHQRFVAWACLFLVIATAFYVRDLNPTFLPETAPIEAQVQTEAPGLVAEQVEQLVTRPIESTLAGTLGVAHVHSQSSQGLSLVTLTFSAGADPVRTRQALVENLSELGGKLPPGAGSPRLWPMRSQGGPVLQVGFLSDKLDAMGLRDLIEWTVRPRLLAVPGVSDVSVVGGEVRRLEVRARPGDLSDSDLGFLDILNAVRRSTGVAGAGFIDTPNQRVLIEPQGQALTVDAVGAGQIQAPGAAPVRINDVADVVEAAAPAYGDALIDGKRGVLITINRQHGADALDVTHAVERSLSVLKPALDAQGVEMRRDLDRPASFTSNTMRAVGIDLLIGAALVAVMLILALRDVRIAFVALISLPLTFLFSLAVLKFMGWGLNAMTLGGLAVALGVVIDDAVIDVENIAARLRDADQRHASHVDAILAACLDVRAPVIYATLAVVAAVLPLLALTGAQGTLLRPFAGAVIAASLASLVVAALVTPALAALTLRHLKPGHDSPPGSWRKMHRAWFERLQSSARPLVVVSLILAAAALASLLVARPELLPGIHDDHITFQMTAPGSTSLPAMRDMGQRITADLRGVHGVRTVSERIGRDPSGAEATGLETATFYVCLSDALGGSAQEAVERRIASDLSANWGFHPTVRSGFDRGLKGAEANAPFAVTVFGSDLDALDATADRIVQILRTVPGGASARITAAAKAPVVRVDINFNRLAIFGLSVADVLDTIQAAFAGERVAQIYDRNRTIDLAISAQASLRQDPEAVGDLLLRSTSGVSVPLRSVANVYLTQGRAEIEHDDGLRRQVVIAEPAKSDTGRFANLARSALARNLRLSSGQFLDYEGEDRSASVATRNLALSYGLALLAVLGVLTIAFDGRSAIVIIISTLFSLLGGAIAVFLLGGTISLGPIAGLIALFGLAIRSGVLLISRLEDLVIDERQPWSFETLVRGTQQRIAPLFMSSILATLALAPFAFQTGQGGFEILGPLSIVVIAGLISASVAGLFVTPMLTLLIWRPGYARLARQRKAHNPDPA